MTEKCYYAPRFKISLLKHSKMNSSRFVILLLVIASLFSACETEVPPEDPTGSHSSALLNESRPRKQEFTSSVVGSLVGVVPGDSILEPTPVEIEVSANSLELQSFVFNNIPKTVRYEYDFSKELPQPFFMKDRSPKGPVFFVGYEIENIISGQKNFFRSELIQKGGQLVMENRPQNLTQQYYSTDPKGSIEVEIKDNKVAINCMAPNGEIRYDWRVQRTIHEI